MKKLNITMRRAEKYFQSRNVRKTSSHSRWCPP